MDRTGMFEPKTYEDVFKPIGEATTLPAWCYTSREWFEKEKETVFGGAWHFVCLESSLAPGQFVTREFLGNNILVLKNAHGKIKAFYNTCRHRGAPITDEKTGQAKALVCPYHKWAYDLDGKLLKANGLTAESRQRTTCNLNLRQISVEVACNLVFVNFSKQHVSLREYLGDYIESVAMPHRIDRMRCIHHREYTLCSNWKLYIEVDMETLHTPCIHSDSIGKQPVEVLQGAGEWLGVFNRSADTPALKPAYRTKGFPHTHGIYGEGSNGTHFCVILPGFFIVTAQDCMWWIQKTPISENKVSVNVGYCFPEETLEREDFESVYRRYKERWDQVVEEDDWITEYQQKGLNDLVSGIYTDQERVVQMLDQRILRKVLGDRLAGTSEKHDATDPAVAMSGLGQAGPSTCESTCNTNYESICENTHESTCEG
ncbi:aromatic ring-hydroxylating oxygenase subunit alpha [Hahella ganghwensis]|uniref:aromatic ring-hydroxylating oxygenase subunit alpha n=1 Tax=Hahella ganghwensis TaxID=286420 RepID=UPI0003714E71|nr:aromatic ring-hydroxylating dioxygenase subunit alpha [Hahella ganghwensis]